MSWFNAVKTYRSVLNISTWDKPEKCLSSLGTCIAWTAHCSFLSMSHSQIDNSLYTKSGCSIFYLQVDWEKHLVFLLTVFIPKVLTGGYLLRCTSIQAIICRIFFVRQWLWIGRNMLFKILAKVSSSAETFLERNPEFLCINACKMNKTFRCLWETQS